ncbi:MAG: histidine--tRNA ligase [Candidatus Paceibacterota bacterium]|jgi:histidyl-tRNA synthetase|nr:histidine--tRNA ligase [Candidatus Paceibacterota bacterium]
MTKANSSAKKEVPTSVKGMQDIIGEESYAYSGFYEKASEIAMYYGFKPIETPILEKEELFTSGVGQDTDLVEKEMYSLKTKGGDHLVMRPEGTAPIMRAYIEHGMQSWTQPVMLYYKGPFFRHENPQKGRTRQFQSFGLEILGTPKAIADATVIHTTMIILKEAGLQNLVLNINSIGDRECRPKYVKELANYYKKHLSELCVDCKRRVKENPLRLLDCKNPKCQVIKEGAPSSVTHLCDECRSHFKEVLEYLEALNIPYRINNNLVRGLDYYSRTVFEITEETYEDVPAMEAEEKPEAKGGKKGDKNVKESEIVAVSLALGGGGRYDYLAKNLGSKKDIPAIGVGLGVERIFMTQGYKRMDPRIIKHPKVYFIQLGTHAKMRSLNIIEILRNARIPIAQSLAKDSLGSQLSAAEKNKIPYAIIFGEKEAIDDTVIVRDMNTRSQETVKITELAKYVKTIK